MAKVGGPCAHCKATESSRWQNGEPVRSPARFVGKPCCMRRQCAIAFGFRDPANDKKYKSGKKAEVEAAAGAAAAMAGLAAGMPVADTVAAMRSPRRHTRAEPLLADAPPQQLGTA